MLIRTRARTAAKVRQIAYLAVFLSLGWSGNQIACAQMLPPDIDREGEPFSYPSQPTDEIGVIYSPSATEITSEGYLYTGFGELMFFVGPDHQPVSQRLHTLAKGYLPILSYRVTRYGVTYRFEMFSARVGEGSDPPVMNFVRVTASNPTSTKAAAFLTTAVRYQADSSTASDIGDNRFTRPAKPTVPGEYQQPGEVFDSRWTYGFSGNAFVRNQEVLYLFPKDPVPVLGLTLREYYSNFPDPSTHQLLVQPNTPTGVASYSFVLQPGEHRSLDFVMPLLPVAASSALLSTLRSVRFDEYREQVTQFWDKILASGMKINLPEKKVTNTFNASLVYDLLALNKIDNDYVQTVNQLHYHSFYLRDTSDIVRMYDATGYSQIASDVLKFFLTKQQPDGNFLSQAGEYDGWGQTLWIFGEHYRMTHDRVFAKSVYPAISRAVDWFEKATAADPLHLMPATNVRDNEYVPGHLTGYNFLALDGIQAAQIVAVGLGNQEDAQRFGKDYDAFRKNFLALLDELTAKTGGYVPPDLDGNHLGTDWGNLLSVTPEAQLDPHDEKVTATLREAQSKYQEGIMTYSQPNQGQWLHHYLTIKNTLTEVVRGDQEQALRELYAELLHTSATQAGFEFAIRPWSDRDFKGNLTPHGWFAADYRNLLRNMLVREEGNSLHVLSVTSPEWIGADKSISVKDAPTYFGSVSYKLLTRSDGKAALDFHDAFTSAPDAIFVHLPWFMNLVSAVADGEQIPAQDGVLRLPANVRHVKLKWLRRKPIPVMSYAATVADYKAEYRRRFDALLHDGSSYQWQPSQHE